MTIDDRKTFPVDRNMAPYAMIWSISELLTNSVIIGRITLLDGCEVYAYSACKVSLTTPIVPYILSRVAP